MRYLIVFLGLLSACSWQAPNINDEPVIDDCMDRKSVEWLNTEGNKLSNLTQETFCQWGLECRDEEGFDFDTTYCPEVNSGTTDPA
jgi:hypothetical protein